MKHAIHLTLTLCVASAAFARMDNWDAGPNPGSSLDSAHFRWWSPPDAGQLRGVFVVLPGRNGDARGAVANAGWQALATRTGFALMGCQLRQEPKGDYQTDPDGSTAKVINRAVEELAKSNGHAYLTEGPLAFWGTSAGANTIERYTNYFPKRVVAVACIKGTWGPGAFNREKDLIPWLVCVGMEDKPEWVKTALGYYQEGKTNHAPWILAAHPGEGHSTGATQPLAWTFLEEIIGLRLPKQSGLSASTPPRIQRLRSAGNWLGDPDTLEVAPASSFRGKRRDAVWLPGEATAKAWQEYLKSGTK